MTLIPEAILELPVLSESSHLSTSFLDHGGSSNSLIAVDFEISKFQNSELSPVVTLGQLSHNLEFSDLSNMESDCEEIIPPPIKDDTGMSNQDNILNLLTMILEQMMHNYQGLQNQLVQQDWKLSDAIRQLTQDNETFKQEVRFEFQNLRSPGNHPSSSSRSASPVLSSPSVPSSFLVSQNTLIPHFWHLLILLHIKIFKIK